MARKNFRSCLPREWHRRELKLGAPSLLVQQLSLPLPNAGEPKVELLLEFSPPAGEKDYTQSPSPRERSWKPCNTAPPPAHRFSLLSPSVLWKLMYHAKEKAALRQTHFRTSLSLSLISQPPWEFRGCHAQQWHVVPSLLPLRSGGARELASFRQNPRCSKRHSHGAFPTEIPPPFQGGFLLDIPPLRSRRCVAWDHISQSSYPGFCNRGTPKSKLLREQPVCSFLVPLGIGSQAPGSTAPNIILFYTIGFWSNSKESLWNQRGVPHNVSSCYPSCYLTFRKNI